jgi:hypothetical protein
MRPAPTAPAPLPVPGKEPRKDRKARLAAQKATGTRPPGPPYGPPPPGWRPPPGYVAVRRRKVRKWPWLFLLSALCCCYFGKPVLDQAQVSVVQPATVADLTVRDDPASQRTAERLKVTMRTVHWLARDTFGALYSDANGKDVTVFGATGFWLDTEGNADKEIRRIGDTYSLDFATLQSPKSQERGEARRCAVGTAAGDSVVVCTWADHGSIGTGIFTRLDINDSNALLTRLREAIVDRG